MIDIVPLSAGEAAPYAVFTFPSLRPLLESERKVPPVIIGARAEDDPVGMSFALESPNRQFELLSLYVAPLWRGQGVGARLLHALEERYRARDFELGAHFFTVGEEDQGFARFLVRQGWSRPSIRQVVCQTTTERILGSPLSAFARLPPAYRIIDWVDVTAAQKTAIRERKQREPEWFKDDVDPFCHEVGCLLDTSIALVRDDEVVGWLISHALDDQTLRMTCSFVGKELERSGRVLHLWWAAGVRQDARTTLKRAIWTVPVTYDGHVRFVMRHVKPWMESVSFACTTIKRFSDPVPSASSDRSP